MSASDPEVRKIDQIGLLRAKLNRPRVTRDLVVRRRLLELLDGGLDRGLTLVSAPAGFGKTTLVSSWLKGMAAAGAGGAAPPAAWLSLDEQDSDLAVFLHYLIEALRTLFPNAGSETLALLRALSSVPVSHLSTMLSNEIELLPRDFILVLDDYHLLNGQAVHRFLSELMQHWPSGLHLVLISRIDPPLPLARLRARDKITEVRTGDLRFTSEEASAYLEQVLEIHVGQRERDLVERETEGWIAALRLAALALRTAGDIDNISSSLVRGERSISGYMQDEVLARQVPAIQTFLLKTSILERFCAPLCEAVVEQSDPAWSVRGCMDWIERADLFVVSLDDRGQWYRYHPLFRDFLRERLMTSFRPEVVAALHCKAVAWFAQQGLPREAVRHALESGDLDLAASLIESRLRDELNGEDKAALAHWLSLLPEELVERRPWLLMIKVWSLTLSWQLGRQSKVLARLEALLDQDGGTTLPAEEARLLRGNIAAVRAQEAYLKNQPARCVALCEEALEAVPSSWVYVRGAAKIYWGLGMAAGGQSETAERLLLEEYESLDDKTTGYALRLLQPLCFNYLNDGRLEAADRTARVMLQQAVRGGKPIPEGWARLSRGLVSYHWNELEVAEEHFAELVQQRYHLHPLATHHSMIKLALVHQARGECAEAMRLAEMLGQFQLEQSGREGDEVHSLRARLMLEQGDLEGAFRWADSFAAPVPDRALLWAEVPHLTLARILVARNHGGDLCTAVTILDELLEVVERTCNIHSRIPIQALRALALDTQGHAERALTTLQEAVDLARPGGFLRPFLELGPRMAELLSRLAEQMPDADFVERILSAFGGSQAATMLGDKQARAVRPNGPAPGVPALVEPLTTRELEILGLLGEPKSPKEIARTLDISYLTVKRHSINLYGKLGVNARWDAVNRAIELGLLPPR
jgi:LuxR family maltose regulon positive regulatory protein